MKIPGTTVILLCMCSAGSLNRVKGGLTNLEDGVENALARDVLPTKVDACCSACLDSMNSLITNWNFQEIHNLVRPCQINYQQTSAEIKTKA